VATSRTTASSSIKEEVVNPVVAITENVAVIVVVAEAVKAVATAVVNPSNRDRDSATTSRLLNANSLNKNRDVLTELTALSLTDPLNYAPYLATRATKEVAVTAVEDTRTVEVAAT
jgi:hypothetical protein